MKMDLRKEQILSVIVDEYITTGEPVGSKTVQAKLKIAVSSATVRNDMAYLESLGLLEQPHTSAGRIPTFKGYRLYIDRLIQTPELTQDEKNMISNLLTDNSYTADMLLDNAVNILSDITQLAVVGSTSLPQISVISKVEVIPAGNHVYALLLITSMGTVKNKVCRLEFDITDEQLEFFKRFVNDNLKGINIEKFTPAMLQKTAVSLGAYMISLSPLLAALFELTNDLSHQYVNLIGEQNLLKNNDIEKEQALLLLNQKNRLVEIMSSVVDGINVIFPQEHDEVLISNSSMILSDYQIGGKKAGTFGVIGPLRLDYKHVIPYIKFMSEKVTDLLSAEYGDSTEEDDKLKNRRLLEDNGDKQV